MISDINLYRIVHQDNINYILQNGMFCVENEQFDSNNIFIGDSTLTNQRHVFKIPLPDAGNLGDYIPFYFGYRSPMLYNIKTGHRGIPMWSQSQIIYIVCKMQPFFTDEFTIVFTNGHAKSQFTSYFTQEADLKQLDWAAIKALQWQNTPHDPDKMRRKQAECLIKSHIPPQYITALVVYDASTQAKMIDLIQKTDLKINVYINPKGYFYY